MANVTINDLPLASVLSTMQLETDIGGAVSNKITISDLTTYLSGVLPIGGGVIWNVASSNTSLLNANGYIAVSASPISFTLPLTASIGDTYDIVNFGTGGFTITQNAGQTIYFGTQTTTTGASGSCSTIAFGDVVKLLCVNDDLDFMIISSVGNLNLI